MGRRDGASTDAPHLNVVRWPAFSAAAHMTVTYSCGPRPLRRNGFGARGHEREHGQGPSPLPHREIRVLDQAHLEEVVELDGRGHTQRRAQGRAIHTEGRAIGNVSALSFARLAPQF
jgi:hypothetical protein